MESGFSSTRWNIKPKKTKHGSLCLLLYETVRVVFDCTFKLDKQIVVEQEKREYIN